MSNRANKCYQRMLDASAKAQRELMPALLRSVCNCIHLDATPEEKGDPYHSAAGAECITVWCMQSMGWENQNRSAERRRFDLAMCGWHHQSA